MRIESGTCNVCSAPCSSCMHYNRSMSAITSKNESGFSGVICVKGEEADSSSVINLPICKNRICDDLQHVASEASNLVSTTSSHDSYFENADSKAIFKKSTIYDASDDVEMPQDVSSREFIEEERPLKRKTGHDQVSSQSNFSAQLEYRASSGQGEEQSDLECHGDNLLYTPEVRDAVSDYIVGGEKKTLEYSNMTMNSSFKVNNKAVPNEGGHDNHDHVTRETHSIVEKLNGTGDSSLLEEIIKHAQVDNVESSSGSLTAGSKHNSSAFPNLEASTPNQIKSEFSVGNSKIDELCEGTRTVTVLEKPFDNGSKETDVNGPPGRISTALDATNGQGPHVRTRTNTEGENSDSDVLLDDVKVCDICGDAGREDLLAVCSKCSDGAEHTYCMSEMLHKVPEGDWLCEECKIKEMNNQNVDRCEAVSERLSSTCLNESSKNALSSSIPKMSPKLDSGPTDLVTPGPSKPPQSSHILTRRQADLPEEGKASERNVSSIETASPRKKSILSRQFSLKSQIMENVKTTSIPTLPEVHPVKGSEAFSRSKASLSSTSFKGQTQPHSPHGPLSRSVSFSYSNNVPKVKTLIENASHKQNIAKASMASDLRKDGLVKSLARTTSFNNTTSGRPNTDLLTKSSSFKPSLIEGLRGPKEVKERNTVERKNISAMQNSFVRPSSVVSSSNHPIKVDAKYVHSDGKIKGVSETDVARSSRGFNDANDLGVNEGKKQTSCSSKMVGFSEGNSKAEHLKKSKLLNKDVQTSTCAIDGSKRKVEIVSPHSVQSSESGRKDESMRDSSSSTSSRLSSQGGSQKSRCQKCNETGHAAQHCSVDKLQKSTNKLSAEGISNEVVKKHNKWREIVDAAISRSGVLKGSKPDACGALLASKVDANCEAASKFASSDFIQRNGVSVVESGNGKGVSKHSNVDSTKNSTVTNSGPPAVVPVEVSHVSKADDTTGKFSEKPFSETLQELSPLAASTLKASAVPKLECIWHGSFNVVGSGKCPEMFEGIQAHLSSCASQRVFEAAMKVPYSVHLEEVSHISLWPSHFQKIGAQEENIGLFFFAEDSESYERSYRKLMDRMHKNDLALRGNIDGIELLIFRSNKLPMKSQRWNMMYYLWGMFRARRGYGLPGMGGQKKASIANLDVEIPKQDSSIPPITDFRKAQNSENSSILNKLSDEWRPSKMMRREQDDSVHMFPVVSGIEHKTCRRLEASVENSLTQVVADPNVARGQPSFPVGNSSGTIADPQRVADSSKFVLLMPASKSCSEGKNDERLQKKIVTDCTNRKTGDLGEESNLISAYNQAGDEFSRIEGNLRDKECSTSSVAIIDDDDPRQNVLMADCLNNRKRGRSCSIETHGMPSNTTEMGQLREGQSWMSIDDERERKKICYASDSSGTEANASTRLSSKIHPLHSTILSEQTEGEGDRIYGATPESSKITERCFFPTDLIPVQNNRSADIIHIPSSDDEETAKSCTPDLELALGGKSKSAAPPIPFAPFGGRKHLKAGSLGDEGDDLSASLSLSIGFPTAERERSAKNFFKKEQVSPEKPSADTSLFLFGRFSNS